MITPAFARDAGSSLIGHATADIFSVHSSSVLTSWLQHMIGLKAEEICVPWFILEADGESQLAFLSSIVEPDLIFQSSSVEFLRGVFEILSSHGLRPVWEGHTVVPQCSTAFDKIGKYSNWSSDQRTYQRTDDFGLPNVINHFIQSRSTGSNMYMTDSGLEINVSGTVKVQEHVLTYAGYDSGKYNDFLSNLKLVSKSMHARVVRLLALRYKWVKVTSIRDAGVQHVYDLSMKPGTEPAYVANGFVSHNTADAALSVFVDMLRSFREMFTRKLFYNKIFPLVSMLNGYTLSTSGKLNVRESLLDSLSPEEALFRMNDGSRLLIPTVSWSKQLKPEGDSTYLEMLKGMTELGVPVPLRVMAAAGGLNIEELLRSQDDDISTRKDIAAYMDRIKALAPKLADGGDGGGGDDQSESSSMTDEQRNEFIALTSADPRGLTRSAVHAGGGRINLADRNFESSGFSEIIGESKTGKQKHIRDQRGANERINIKIAKAVSASDKRGKFGRETISIKP